MSTSTAVTPEESTAGLIQLGGQPGLRDYLAAVWARREFATNMAAGEMRSQNFDTVLGNLWHLLNPLLLVAVYFLMFGVILNASRGLPNFVGFLAVGIFTYGFFQRAATSGAGSIVGNLGLIRSLQFPRILLPVAATIKEAMAFATTLVVMLLVVLVTEPFFCSRPDAAAVCDTFTVPVSAGWLMLLPLMALGLLFGFGLAFVTARLTDHVRDTANVLPYVFRILFYISGVLYPVDRFIRSPWMQEVFNLNPFYAFVTLSRHYVMATYTATDVPKLWVYLCAWSILLFVIGLFFFRARETRYGRG